VPFCRIYAFPLGQLAATIIAEALFGLAISILRRRANRQSVWNLLVGGLAAMIYCVAFRLLYLSPLLGLSISIGLLVGVPIYIARSRTTWSCVSIDEMVAAGFFVIVQGAWWAVLR